MVLASFAAIESFGCALILRKASRLSQWQQQRMSKACNIYPERIAAGITTQPRSGRRVNVTRFALGSRMKAMFRAGKLLEQADFSVFP